MIINKKGLSDVVTTVIIILLVIAAIGIIWSFVQPTLKKAGEQINTECLTVNIEPVSCGISLTVDNIIVKRNPGVGELTGIKVLVERDGVTELNKNMLGGFEPLSTKGYSEADLGIPAVGSTPADPFELEEGDVVKVGALVGANQQVCDVSPTVVTCVV